MTGRGRPGERWARWCNTAAIDAATTGPKGSLNCHGKREKKIEGCGARKASCSRRFPFRHQFSLKQLKFLFEKRSWWDGSSRPVRGWWAPRDSNPFPSLAMQRGRREKKRAWQQRARDIPSLSLANSMLWCSRCLLPLQCFPASMVWPFPKKIFYNTRHIKCSDTYMEH